MKPTRTHRTRHTRTLLVTASAALLALSLTACGQEARGGSRYKADDGKGGTVGIAMPTKSSERWIADGQNMAKQFQKSGYKTDLQYGDDKVENQVAQLENMITKGHRLLVVGAIDGSALTDVLQRAKDAGIPVISYDRLIMGTENVDYYASFDNEKVGELQGRYILDRLGLKKPEKGGKSYNVELFAGSPDDNNTKYFWNGAIKVLKPYLDSGQLVVRSKQTKMNQATTLRWDGGTAQKRMDDLISKNYGEQKVDAVLSPYDGISIGIISALKSAGYSGKDLPVVTGQDAELASVKSIMRGDQTQTVFKDTRKLAAQAVQMGDAVLNDKKPKVNNTKDYDNGKKVVPSYLLKPVSIDKKNTQLLVDEGYFTAGQLR
ncbi:multiple monosaccharide ABC transporter substrate-binding protein [Streptomyces monticola]|uniref:Multiple monosaccharide ABC transporter substrate-binding protein n=1 Tax=Streptomyces monticola TaxID=2666263 RepID=A0ABW2JEE9_9ACTN